MGPTPWPLLGNDGDVMLSLSQNRPNYKSSSAETIELAIKFPDLSLYNLGSQPKPQRISNQLCNIPRS